MIVYDENGVAHKKEPVDAKECIERLGWTTELPASVQDDNELGGGHGAESGGKKERKKTTEE
jgi:hypothetical protein